MKYIKHNILAILALITSIFAIYIANQSNRIAEIEIAPLIWLYIENVYDKDLNYRIQDVLLVKNDGSPVVEVRAKAIVFLDVHRSDTKGFQSSVDTILLKGFYFTNFPVPQTTGIVRRISGYENTLKLNALNVDFSELARTKSESGYLTIRRYALVEYKDRSGKQITKYFSIDPVMSSRELSQENGKKIFKHHETLSDSGLVIDIDMHTALDIFEKI